MTHPNARNTQVFQLAFVRFVLIYCFIWIAIVYSIEIFAPLRLEVSISLIACCVIPLLIHYFDNQHMNTPPAEVRQQSFKLHFWASIIFLVGVPFFSSDKISALNYPLHFQSEQIAAPISGYISLGEIRIPTHRQPVEGVIFSHQSTNPVICDLLTRKRCPYANEFDQIVSLQLNTRTLWPYRHDAVIFNFKSEHFSFNKEQHLKFYRQQQYAVAVYFIFIFFPSFWMFYRLRSVLLRHYFNKITPDSSPDPQ